MKALTYIEHNHFALLEKPEPEIDRSPGCHRAGDAGLHLHQ